MMNKSHKILKIISLSLVLALLSEHVSWAVAELPSSLKTTAAPGLSFLAQEPWRLELSPEHATLEDFHRGTNGRLIIHVQDPHSNFGGQEHMAAMLGELSEKYSLSLVLSEGGAGESSLLDFRETLPRKTWQRVAKRWLREAKLSGEEYWNLTSDRPLSITGIENLDDYFESVRAYAVLAKRREKTLEYLQRIRRAVNDLKPRMYPRDLVEYERFASDGSKTDKRIDRLAEWMESAGFRSAAPEFVKLLDCRRAEKSGAPAVSAADLEWGRVIAEMDGLEKRMFAARLTGRPERVLHSIDRYTSLLEAAFSVRMTSGEFAEFEANEKNFATFASLAFLNRQLSENGIFESLVPYKNILEEGKKELRRFYASVDARDRAFLGNAEKALNEKGQSAAFLVAGGYHTEHLKKLFAEKGYSFAVVRPVVTNETNWERYEERLLAPVMSFPRKRESGPSDPRVRGDDLAIKLDSTHETARTALLALMRSNPVYAHAFEPYLKEIAGEQAALGAAQEEIRIENSGARLADHKDEDVPSAEDLHRAFMHHGRSEQDWGPVKDVEKKVRRELLLTPGSKIRVYDLRRAMLTARFLSWWGADAETVSTGLLYFLLPEDVRFRADFKEEVDRILSAVSGGHQYFNNARKGRILEKIRGIQRLVRVRFLDLTPDKRTLPNFMNLVMNLARGDNNTLLLMIAIKLSRFVTLPGGQADPAARSEMELYVGIASKLLAVDVADAIDEALIKSRDPKEHADRYLDYLEAAGVKDERALEIVEKNGEGAELIHAEIEEKIGGPIASLAEFLRARELTADVGHRLKRFASADKKVRQGRRTFSDMPDIFGVRVLVGQEQIENVKRAVMDWANASPEGPWKITIRGEFEAEKALADKPYRGQAHLDLKIEFTDGGDLQGGNLEIQVISPEDYDDYLRGSVDTPAHFVYKFWQSVRVRFAGQVEPIARRLPRLTPSPALNLQNQYAPMRDRIQVPVYRLDPRGAPKNYRVVELSQGALTSDLEAVLGIVRYPIEGFARLKPSELIKQVVSANAENFELLKPESVLEAGDRIFYVEDLKARNKNFPQARIASRSKGTLLLSHFLFEKEKNKNKVKSWESDGEKAVEGLRAEAERILSETRSRSLFEDELAAFARDIGLSGMAQDYAGTGELYGAVGSGIYPAVRFRRAFLEYVSSEETILPGMSADSKDGARLAFDEIAAAVSLLATANGNIPQSVRARYFEPQPGDEGAPQGALIRTARRYELDRSASGGILEKIRSRPDRNREWDEKDLAGVYRAGWEKIDRIAHSATGDASEQRLIRNAYITAFLAHEFFNLEPGHRVRRAGGLRIPYPVHLVETALSRFEEFQRFAQAAGIPLDATALAAALLHDAFEDTKLKHMSDEELAQILDSPERAPAIIRIVRAATKDKDRGESEKEFMRRMVDAFHEQFKDDRTLYYQLFFIKLADKLNSVRHDLDLIPDDKLTRPIAKEILRFYRQRKEFVKYFVNFFYRTNNPGVQAAALYWNEQFLMLDALQRRRIAALYGEAFVEEQDHTFVPVGVRKAGADLWSSYGRKGSAESFYKAVPVTRQTDKDAFIQYFGFVEESLPPLREKDWIQDSEHLRAMLEDPSQNLKGVLLYRSDREGNLIEPIGGYLYNNYYHTLLSIAVHEDARGSGATHVLLAHLREKEFPDPESPVELYMVPNSLEHEVGPNGYFSVPASRIEEAMAMDPTLAEPSGARLAEEALTVGRNELEKAVAEQLERARQDAVRNAYPKIMVKAPQVFIPKGAPSLRLTTASLKPDSEAPKITRRFLNFFNTSRKFSLKHGPGALYISPVEEAVQAVSPAPTANTGQSFGQAVTQTDPASSTVVFETFDLREMEDLTGAWIELKGDPNARKIRLFSWDPPKIGSTPHLKRRVALAEIASALQEWVSKGFLPGFWNVSQDDVSQRVEFRFKKPFRVAKISPYDKPHAFARALSEGIPPVRRADGFDARKTARFFSARPVPVVNFLRSMGVGSEQIQAVYILRRSRLAPFVLELTDPMIVASFTQSKARGYIETVYPGQFSSARLTDGDVLYWGHLPGSGARLADGASMTVDQALEVIGSKSLPERQQGLKRVLTEPQFEKVRTETVFRLLEDKNFLFRRFTAEGIASRFHNVGEGVDWEIPVSAVLDQLERPSPAGGGFDVVVARRNKRFALLWALAFLLDRNSKLPAASDAYRQAARQTVDERLRERARTFEEKDEKNLRGILSSSNTDRVLGEKDSLPLLDVLRLIVLRAAHFEGYAEVVANEEKYQWVTDTVYAIYPPKPSDPVSDILHRASGARLSASSQAQAEALVFDWAYEPPDNYDYDVETVQSIQRDAVLSVARAYVENENVFKKGIVPFEADGKNVAVRMRKAAGGGATMRFYVFENGRKILIGRIVLSAAYLNAARRIQSQNRLSQAPLPIERAQSVVRAFGQSQALLRLAGKALVGGEPVLVSVVVDRLGLGEQGYEAIRLQIADARRFLAERNETDIFIQIVSLEGRVLDAPDLSRLPAPGKYKAMVVAPPEKSSLSKAKETAAGFLSVEEARQNGDEFAFVPYAATVLAAAAVARRKSVSPGDPLDFVLDRLIPIYYKTEWQKNFSAMYEVRDADPALYQSLLIHALERFKIREALEILRGARLAVGTAA